MDDDFCEMLRCCCECGLCIGLCCLCCKDNDSHQQRNPYYPNGPQNVTVTTQPASIPNQPYPVHNYGGGGPAAQNYPPQPGYAPSHVPVMTPYPPVPATSGPPYPPAPPGGAMPYMQPAPYPPQPAGFQTQPPSYDVAMGQPPLNPPPPMMEAYGKQAPYNPNFRG